MTVLKVQQHNLEVKQGVGDIMVKLVRWRPTEDRYLIRNYPTTDMKKMEKYLKRNKSSIISRANRIGLVRKACNWNKWSTKENKELAEMYPTANIRDMEKHFGRTYSSIVSHAWWMGIKRTVPRAKQTWCRDRKYLSMDEKAYDEIIEAQRRYHAREKQKMESK